jgi:FtsH-binding integral membrane protein
MTNFAFTMTPILDFFICSMNNTIVIENTSSATLVQRNRVLRNTYWLLALSMLPTVLGAYIGVQTGIMASLRGGFGLIVFLAGAFGFMFAIEKTKNSGLGVVMLLAFTGFMGLMLSGLLTHTLRFSNGAQLIMLAFGATAGIFFAMASLATVIKTRPQQHGQMAVCWRAGGVCRHGGELFCRLWSLDGGAVYGGRWHF